MLGLGPLAGLLAALEAVDIVLVLEQLGEVLCDFHFGHAPVCAGVHRNQCSNQVL